MRKKLKSFDYVLLIMVVTLAIFGVIVIGSATHIHSHGDRALYNSQIIWVTTGLIFLIIVSFIDYHFICKFYIPIYILNILLLIAVYIYGLIHGVTVARWIYFGSFGLQPSEFCKIFMIIFMSTYIYKNHDKINEPITLLTILALAAIPTILILIQPSLSASMVIVALTVSLLFAAGLDYKYIFKTLIVVIPLSIVFIIDVMKEAPLFAGLVLKDYQITRIRDLILNDTGAQTRTQTDNSIIAIASGQLTGQGLHQGTMNQLNFLIEPYNDFIFAVIGEEFGFIGSSLLIILMLAIVLKCMHIASKASDVLGKMIAIGVGSLLAFQIFLNISVATDIVPNTGIGLPFVSSGGSAMWVNMICIGLVISVGMNKKKSMFEE